MPIRTSDLDEQLHRYLFEGSAYVTAGIAALGKEDVDTIIRTIAVYQEFCDANSSYVGERSFGMIEAMGRTILFKVEYFDSRRRFVSSDPEDPDHTEKVLTIMLASEF
jgi:hypothetical protein